MTPSTSTLAQDLVRIHSIIKRALNFDTIKGVEYIQTGFPTADALLASSWMSSFTISTRMIWNR